MKLSLKFMVYLLAIVRDMEAYLVNKIAKDYLNSNVQIEQTKKLLAEVREFNGG